MLATYNESRRDPNLLALDNELSLVDSKLIELLGKVDTGESGAAWKTAYDALHAFKRANLRKDPDAAREALQDLERVISRGHASSAAWDELSRWIEQRRKLSESETKRRVAGRDLVHADQAMLFVIALTGAVRDHVHDPDILARISADLARVAPNVADGNRQSDAA